VMRKLIDLFVGFGKIGTGIRLCVGLFVVASFAGAQTTAPPSQTPADGRRTQLVQSDQQTAPPITITLHDALDLAKKNDARFLGAVGDTKVAHEDRIQARNATLPSISESTQYLGTQGNGKTPNGRFVTQDGVHVYREWGVFREDMPPDTYMLVGMHRASIAEATARAKVEIAERGLTASVTENYYALVAAQRKYATAQQALEQSKNFLNTTDSMERGGQAPHSDVIKAQIQYGQQQQTSDEANLTMEEARLNLAVRLFPILNEDFVVVDDLDSPHPLPSIAETRTMALHENPDLRVASGGLDEANLGVLSAKGAFLPSLSIETDYGIEANDFALRSVVKAEPTKGPLPNLGYFVQASLTIPVWDWGTLRSKLHQAEYKQQQAHAELTEAQRQVLANLYAFYDEASVARSAVEQSRQIADLASESLRLITLRYQAGESSTLEVVDAENTLTASRNAYDDARRRYRSALANLQTLTGTF